MGKAKRRGGQRPAKIFISWSSDYERRVAEQIGSSISSVFNGVEPWISSVNIRAGQQWFSELMNALAQSKFAIACLSRRTSNSPWIMFESGAVSAKLAATKLVPLALDFDISNLVDPLARFNGVAFDQANMEALFRSINESVGSPLAEEGLRSAFNNRWPQMETAVRKILDVESAIDVFLSAPMASFDGDSEYQAFRQNVLKVVKPLRDWGVSVFCALEAIDSMDKFDTHGISTQEDIRRLQKCTHFVMLYPQKLATSALFEAGYALALGRPSLFFVRNENDLPFLLQRLPEAVTNVSILDSREWKTYEDIAYLIERNAKYWFARGATAELKS